MLIRTHALPSENIGCYLLEDGRKLALFLFAAFSIGWVWYLWLFTDAAWLHPELLGTAAYVWNSPENATLANQSRMVFDWKAFDPNVNRVRPLNDVFEVVDAIARPYLTRWIGPNASLTPSALLTVLLAPTLMYAWLRRVTRQHLPAIVLCMVFIASIGFLSITIAYIRPAKKLNLILLCASLFFAERYRTGKQTADFAVLWASLLASFFSDELGLTNFVIIGVLYWRSLITAQSKLSALFFLSLPVVFLALTKWGLPGVYLRFSVHGAWDALADSKKFEVFGYLLDPQFYLAAAVQTARSMLSTVGIATHVPATQAIALVILLSAPALHAWHWRLRSFHALAQDRFILATVALAAASTFATLLDWYPFPYEVSYLGSYNYYYHSSIVVPMVVWLAFGWESLSRALAHHQENRRTIFMAATFVVGLIVVPANFVMFDRINHLVQVIHLYPFTNSRLYEALDRVALSANREPVTVELQTDRVNQLRSFEEDLRLNFGSHWRENGYYDVLQMVKGTPIMTRAHLGHLIRAFFPFTPVTIRVEGDRDYH